MSIASGNQARELFAETVSNGISYWQLSAKSGQITQEDLDSVQLALRYGEQDTATSIQSALLMSLFPNVLSAGDKTWASIYERTGTVNPSSSRFKSQLTLRAGVLHWKSGEIKKAEAQFAIAHRYSNSARSRALSEIGLFLCEWNSGGRDKARRRLARLEKLAKLPDFPRSAASKVLLLAASVAFARYDYRSAITGFQRGLQTAPGKYVAAQILLNIGLCEQALANHKKALKAYNRAAKLLQTIPNTDQELARLEILRAATHLRSRGSGQTYRLKPAMAALARAATISREENQASRALIEEFMGKTYVRSGNIQRGLDYLNSALSLSENANEQTLFADIFESLTRIEQKSPAGL
jgi:tetratricopeptide (TPR) repeat protein